MRADDRLVESELIIVLSLISIKVRSLRATPTPRRLEAVNGKNWEDNEWLPAFAT